MCLCRTDCYSSSGSDAPAGMVSQNQGESGPPHHNFYLMYLLKAICNPELSTVCALTGQIENLVLLYQEHVLTLYLCKSQIYLHDAGGGCAVTCSRSCSVRRVARWGRRCFMWEQKGLDLPRLTRLLCPVVLCNLIWEHRQTMHQVQSLSLHQHSPFSHSLN